MYKFLLVFLVGVLSAQQSCKLNYSNTSLSKEGEMIFTIKNQSNKKTKVPNIFNSYRIRPTDIQIYNENKGDYENIGYSFVDATCLTMKECFGKMTCLKKDESKEYKVKIIPGIVSKAFKEKKKYRFKLAFDTYLFSSCNEYLTDWLYYQN
jgi:hypothetical protein